MKCVFFEVRTEILYTLWTSFGFKGLILSYTVTQALINRPDIYCRLFNELFHVDFAPSKGVGECT
jgi:hypothetical protein